jgi:molybdopterin-containing oxidoreductase family iron-sulfur binding subunit
MAGASGEMAYIGPRLSMTAANADHFVQIPAGREYAVALAILQEVAANRRNTSGLRMSRL